jgi:hypothetical protein
LVSRLEKENADLKNQLNAAKVRPGNPHWKGRLSTVDLLLPTSVVQLLLKQQTLFTCFIKQATLMRRSTVLSLPLQFVFPGLSFVLTRHQQGLKPLS